MVLSKKHNMLPYSCLLMLVLLLPTSFAVHAQTDEELSKETLTDLDLFDEGNEQVSTVPKADRKNETIDKRSVDKSAWEKAREGLSYNGKPPADEYETAEGAENSRSGEGEGSYGNGNGSGNRNGDGNGNGSYGRSDNNNYDNSDERKEREDVYKKPPRTWFKLPDWVYKAILYTAAVLFIILLVYLIYRLAVNYSGNPDNKTVGYKGSISENLQQIEENLLKSDLEIALDKAIAEGDFKTAIRIYYLMIIKELSVKQWIKWKRDKTNGEYVREMRDRNEFDAFSRLTLMFETVWYGDTNIDKELFDRLSPDMERFVKHIKTPGKA